MFKSVLEIDPTKIITKRIQDEIDKNYYKESNHRNKLLMFAMKNNVIKWYVERDCGDYNIGINWWGHAKSELPFDPFGKKLTMGDIKYCIAVLADGCGVKPMDFTSRFDNEVSITTLHTQDETNGMLDASFYISLGF